MDIRKNMLGQFLAITYECTGLCVRCDRISCSVVYVEEIARACLKMHRIAEQPELETTHNKALIPPATKRKWFEQKSFAAASVSSSSHSSSASHTPSKTVTKAKQREEFVDARSTVRTASTSGCNSAVVDASVSGGRCR